MNDIAVKGYSISFKEAICFVLLLFLSAKGNVFKMFVTHKFFLDFIRLSEFEWILADGLAEIRDGVCEI